MFLYFNMLFLVGWQIFVGTDEVSSKNSSADYKALLQTNEKWESSNVVESKVQEQQMQWSESHVFKK